MNASISITVRESESCFHLSGGTWAYALSRATGLLERAVVRGESWLAGPVPDLWAATAVDPRAEAYHARHATADVRLVSAAPDCVVIESEGGFARVDGSPLPLVRHLRYTFAADGTVQIDVTVRARASLPLRWLSLGRGVVERSTCAFLAHEGDVAENPNTCRPACHDLASGDYDAGGRFLPWIQFGNDRGGLEVVFPHSHLAGWGWTDTCPYPTGDPLGRAGELMTVRVQAGRPSWEAFALRNLHEPVAEGWYYADTFYLSLLPGKEPRPAANDVRVWWLGPHQYSHGWRCPDEESIARWAAAGANLVIGGANWRSGDYSHPEHPEETERFIETCHRYGLKVLPYLTFTDLEFGAPAFAAHGKEWRIEPVAEFNYRTHLMCYGAEGWQEHWQREVAAAWERFPFDGLYLDFWAGKLLCRNERHGCVGPHGRFNAPGLRRMARFAAGLVAQREGLLVANCNILPLAMLNNWFDIRLLGEWADPEQTDPVAQRAFYHPHRFGAANLLLVGKVPVVDQRWLGFAAAFQGTPVLSGGRTPAERELLSRRARLLASFGTGKATARTAHELPALPELEGVSASLYFREDNGEALVTLSRAAAEPASISLAVLPALCGPLPGRCLVACVETGELLGGRALAPEELPGVRLEVPGESLRTLWVKPDPGRPCLLYTLSGNERPATEWNADERTLTFTVAHPSLAAAEVMLAGPTPVTLLAGGEPVPVAGAWPAHATVPCNTEVRATFAPEPLPQLRMRFTRFDTLPEPPPLPEGYVIRPYRPGDEAGWAAVLTATGSLGQWDAQRVIRLLQGERHAVPEGSFLATWHGLPVATTCTVVGPNEEKPEIGWVGVMPEHQGHRLAFHLCLACLRFLRDRGVRECFLLTDDFRVPAIKTYLRLGFEPEVTHESHPARWQKILAELRS